MKKNISFLSSLFAIFFTSNVSAGLIGETVKIDWYYPNSTTVYSSSGNVIVGAGNEWNPGSGVSAVNISDSSFTIQNDTSGWSGASFNGFVISDVLGLIDDFTSFSMTSSNGLSYAADLAFGADFLSVNFTSTGATNYNTNGTYTFVFSTADATSVPEPASIALLGLGLAGIGFCRKTKKA